ncbi:MAG: cardiolipin synthase [Defluviitaleaceae bacterium]|nr:cardiolipin synthase [Defluviitaleaceae bacterium]
MGRILSRLNISIVLVIMQIALIIYLALMARSAFPFMVYVGMGISLLVFLFIIKSDKASAYKISWVIILLTFPVAAGAIYLLAGNKRPTKKVAAQMDEHALIAGLLDADGNLPFVNKIQCGRMYSLFEYVRNSSSYHAYNKTQVKYYTLGELMFEDMLAELEKAQKFIFIEYFIIKDSYMWDRLLDVMIRKASGGVDVRLIVDDLGSHRLFSRTYVKNLRAQGIKVLRFNPIVPYLQLFMNNRDHRKITVVDGHTAFNGGMNISDEYINKKSPFGIWKDTGVRLYGDAVWSFTLMFIEIWDTFCKADERINDYLAYKNPICETIETDGLVLPYGDTPLDKEALGENIYVDMLNQAQQYVYIYTPYLIISEKMIQTLQLTARRGIDVRLITPGIADKKLVHRLSRSYYNFLLEAGVKIYEYTPGFLHAKSFISDDEVAVVGTINLDYRSLYLHFECATLLFKTTAIQDIKNDFEQTLEASREIKQDNRRRRIWNEIIDSILHLFAPLM